MVRGDAFAALPEFVEDLGLPAARLAERSGLLLPMLDGERSLVPLHALGCFLDAASREAGNEALGLHFARFAGSAPLLEMGKLLSTRPTLASLVITSGELIDFHTQGAVMACEQRGAQVLWTYRLDERVREGRDAGNQIALMMMLGLLRAALGRHWVPDAVMFEQKRPDRPGEFEAAFGPRLIFGAPACGILFERALVARPLLPGRGVDRDGAALLHRRFLENAPPARLADAVRRLIAESLSHGGPLIERIARSCGFSARTLQRELKREGVVFSRLVDEIRRSEAERRTRTSDESLLSIALDLGYSEASNFTHAFRRWAGVTPSEYRRAASVAAGLAAHEHRATPRRTGRS